jgi:hypothetical protein
MPGPRQRRTSASGPVFFEGEIAPKVSITLPTELFRELQSAAASMEEPHYTAANYIADVLTSDLASRRLAMMPGRLGGVTAEPANSYRLCLPEMVR